MQKLSKSVLWFWTCDSVNCNTVKSLTPKNVILRNQQKTLSHSPYWRVASFKHLLMTLINTLFVCVRSVFFWCRKDWRNWFHWKDKLDSMAAPLGNWLYPKSDQVAIWLILGGRVTYNNNNNGNLARPYPISGEPKALTKMKLDKRKTTTTTKFTMNTINYIMLTYIYTK